MQRASSQIRKSLVHLATDVVDVLRGEEAGAGTHRPDL
jgi:hypothetical protein